LDRLIFLTKQILIKSDNLSQLEFGPPISFQFAFIACRIVAIITRQTAFDPSLTFDALAADIRPMASVSLSSTTTKF
jgi:hypothetical protein